VLSDVMMPGLDGLGLVRAMRQDPALMRTPAILLSARAGEEAAAEGLGAGADDYIVKPFTARDLLVRVASKLAVAKVAREAFAIEDAARTRLYGHFMQAPFPIGVLRGPQHVFELANAPALETWGKDRSILGKPLLEAIPELRGQPHLGYLDEVLRTGVAYQATREKAVLRRGASVEDAWYDFTYAPLREPDGELSGVLVAGFEVTAQVRADQQLAQLLASTEASERQFRQLVENLPELAWTAGPDGAIDYYNRRWYEYTGTSAEHSLGWGWTSVMDPTRLEQVLQRWRHSIHTGEAFELEFPLRGADGILRWFLTRMRPLREPDGHITRWFGSSTNIDERRRNEDFRETFVGILGHDLRNPLSTVLMTARVLNKRKDLPPDTYKKLERVVSSGVRMQRMIEQLLDLTRARLAGGIPVALSDDEVELAPLVSKIVEEVRVANPLLRIELEAQGSCAARVDSDRFEQVISNLLGNAATHGDAARPIKVALEAKEGSVRLSVHNHGRPIDPAFLPLLFNPFARGEKPQGHSAGLGLGLYISERIIDSHRGQLFVHSTPEAGTRFEVILPRRERR
jgi:PAS domain S-box-containing protein